jgi:N-formylglutamate amidohydrolase
MKITSFHIREASNKEVPIVVSIPHTGIYVPEAIRAEFASSYISSLPMTDWYLHHLYDFLPAMGITTIYGTYSRFVADVNRPPDDRPLYPGRYETGFVAAKTFWGEEIYSRPPSPEEIKQRRDLVHAPYHARLLELLQSRITRFGAVVLIDAHSVASRANLVHDALKDDVYLGDRDGKTNSGWLTSSVEHGFRAAGLRVSRNNPYKGGYITEHYGQMARVAALQVEMRWGLYLDESHPERTPTHAKFGAFKSVLSDVFTGLLSEINKRRQVSK